MRDLSSGRRDHDASAIIGAVLATLHAAHPGPPPKVLTPLEVRFAELFDATKQPHADPILQRGAKTAQTLLNHPLNEVVLHGDLHHENILQSSSRGWLAIDAKGLRGETTYDRAMAVLNPQSHDALVMAPDRIAAITETLAHALNVGARRLLQFTFAHACLCACWSMETSTFSSDRALSMARIIERMLAA
ncbi:MAG: aminoglycoside phosphotransferase family protein [Pseudomonadota bacterium]